VDLGLGFGFGLCCLLVGVWGLGVSGFFGLGVWGLGIGQKRNHDKNGQECLLLLFPLGVIVPKSINGIIN
jgi:hypothetical protein